MKRISVIVSICLIAILVLSACNDTAKVTATPEPVQTAEPKQTPAPTPEPAPEPSAEPEPEPVPEEDDTDWEAIRAVAEQFIEKDVSGLIEALGEPSATDYASSCLGPGEDGELVYGGFTVYTYREGNTEIVKEVV